MSLGETITQTNLGCFAWQNGRFCIAIWAKLVCKIAHFANIPTCCDPYFSSLQASITTTNAIALISLLAETADYQKPASVWSV